MPALHIDRKSANVSRGTSVEHRHGLARGKNRQISIENIQKTVTTSGRIDGMKRNHCGQRMGQDHHHAKLPDWAVARMRELREKNPTLWPIRTLAELFRCGLSTARDICDYATRPL